MRNTTIEPAGLTNEELLSHVKQLVRRERVHLVELLLHLGELDARQAYLADGAPSLFRWCTGVLHLSEAAAFTRIRAARVGRRLPLVLERLRSGDIHVHAISRLAPHLTIANHRELLDEARHAPRETIDRIVARFQAPIRPSSRVVAQAVPESPRDTKRSVDAELELFGTTLLKTVLRLEEPTTDSWGARQGTPIEPPPAAIEARSTPQETAWRLHLTLNAVAHQDLERLQELMRHQVPDGDPAAIVARALALLREQVEKRRLGRVRKNDKPMRRDGRTKAPRVGRTTAPRVGRTVAPRDDRAGSTHVDAVSTPSRHIPAAVRREVAERDEEQCAFMSADGRRCTERSWLEFHHLVPHARGGRAIPGNLELRCRAHNRYEAERDFDGFVREVAADYGVRRRYGSPSG